MLPLTILNDFIALNIFVNNNGRYYVKFQNVIHVYVLMKACVAQ